MKIRINAVLGYCTLCCFQYYLSINGVIAAYFIYYKYMNRNKNNVSVHDYVYQAKNYKYNMRVVK